MQEMALLERDDLVEQKKTEDISKGLVIDVLSNEQQLALVLSNVSQYLASEVSFVKARISEVQKQADLERLDAVRKSIAKWRVDSGKNYAAMKKANKDLIAKADEGFELVVSAQKSAESEIEQVLADKKQEFEQEKLRKKALADAMAKLNTHTIDPLLPSADIETAIDDFVIAFGDFDYQESQDNAEAVFQIKKSQFDVILAAAITREENERKIKQQEEQARQRANINVTFPIAEISGYAARSSADIQARIDWTVKVDMSAFELVANEAETTKQSCLNMLAAFLPMAVTQEAKEAADKAELKRVTEIKAAIALLAYEDYGDLAGQDSSFILQLLQDAKNGGINLYWKGDFAEFKNEAELTLKDTVERLTIILDGTLKKEADDAASKVQEHLDSIPVYQSTDVEQSQSAMPDEDFNGLIASVKEAGQIQRGEIEAAAITIFGDDADFVSDVAKIIGEPAAVFIDNEPKVVEVVSEPVADDCVLIPVKHLRALILSAEQALKQFGEDYNDDVSNALEFAKSLI